MRLFDSNTSCIFANYQNHFKREINRSVLVVIKADNQLSQIARVTHVPDTDTTRFPFLRFHRVHFILAERMSKVTLDLFPLFIPFLSRRVGSSSPSAPAFFSNSFEEFPFPDQQSRVEMTLLHGTVSLKSKEIKRFLPAGSFPPYSTVRN